MARPADGVPRRLQLRRVQPTELYGGALNSRLAAALEGGAPLAVTAALFAWGDATHAALASLG